MRIGRKPSCDFVIPDRRVSRQHAEVFFQHDRLWVRDLGSHNGTWVDGERVGAISRLALRSKLEIEDYVFTVNDQPDAAPMGADVQLSTHSRFGPPPRTTLNGDLGQIEITSVLQALDGSAQTGVLEIDLPGHPAAEIGVRLGRPVWVRYGIQRGEPALTSIVRHSRSGGFAFVARDPGREVEVTRPLTALLLDAARRCDETLCGSDETRCGDESHVDVLAAC